MAKLTLFDLSSGSYSVDLLNQNFQLIENALENTLSRDGTVPNGMSAPLDMNSQAIINLPVATSGSSPVTLAQVQAMGTLILYTPDNHSHAWADISGKPATYAPSAHGHTQADVANLTTDLTAITGRLTTLESEVTVFVQASQPTANAVGDLWFY